MNRRRLLPLLAATACLAAGLGTSLRPALARAALPAPGTRVLLDAHNAYPEQGQWTDRLDRALRTGTPIAIEQDLVWRPASGDRPGRSVVAHGGPFTGDEPGLREHFFERVRPIVERALALGDDHDWPVIVLNLDFKTNEMEHHAAIARVVEEYDRWLCTATKGSLDSPAPIRLGPVLVLTGDDDTQETSFYAGLSAGAPVRLFGAVNLHTAEWADPAALRGQPEAVRSAAHYDRLASPLPFPAPNTYRRWVNLSWAAVESGGPARAGDWDEADGRRLRLLVDKAHRAGLWIRFYTLNGHAAGEERGWGAGYNFGSVDAARPRWRAAIAAGVDFLATDQYELLAAELRRR